MGKTVLRFLPAALVAGLAIAAPQAGLAGGATSLGVSATVSPSAVLSFDSSAAPLVISEDDIRKGYVQVVMRSKLAVTTMQQGSHARPALTMDLSPRPDLFSSVAVESAPAGGAQYSEFRYRFDLVENVRPGAYQAPLSFTIEL